MCPQIQCLSRKRIEKVKVLYPFPVCIGLMLYGKHPFSRLFHRLRRLRFRASFIFTYFRRILQRKSKLVGQNAEFPKPKRRYTINILTAQRFLLYNKSEKANMLESLRDQDLHSVSIWYILVLVLQMILTIVKVRTAFNLQ